MVILSSCRCVNTITWQHHLDSSKAKSKQHKDITCCYKQILESVPYKATTVWPLASYLPDHSRWINYTVYYWCSQNKLMSKVLHNANQCWPATKTYIHQFCVDIGCHLEDILRTMSHRDGWQERVKGIYGISKNWWWYWHYNIFYFSFIEIISLFYLFFLFVLQFREV